MNNHINKYNFIILPCLYFAGYAFCCSNTMNSIALYGVLPTALFFTILKQPRIKIDKYVIAFSLLYLWIFFSYFWATYTDIAYNEIHRCLGVILLSLIFNLNSKDSRIIPWLYLTYICSYCSMWIYAINNIEYNIFGSATADRLNDSKINANEMQYFTFYITFIIFIYGEIVQNKYMRKFLRILFIFTIPLSFYVALATASRSVILILTPLIFLLFFFRYLHRTSYKTKIFVFITVAIVTITLFNTISTTYNQSFLYKRAQKEITEDSRFFLIKDAFKIGIENFPLGVGAGNYVEYSYNKHFSHSSFLELFANQGIIGVLLYCALLYHFMTDQYKRYLKYKDKMFLYFLFFGLLFIIDNMLYVFYTNIWLMSFFVLVQLNSNAYLSKNYSFPNK